MKISKRPFESLRHQSWRKTLTVKNLFKNLVLLVLIVYLIVRFYN
jgi:hypothetical protein